MIVGKRLLNFRIVLRYQPERTSRKSLPRFPSSCRSVQTWSNVPLGPPDPIFGLIEAFKKDNFPQKANLGVGAYRDNNGKSYILPSVEKAEKLVFCKQMDKEYLPITGHAQFCDLAAKFVFGEDSDIIKKNLNLTAQGLSGTGALFIIGLFLKQFYPGAKVIHVPDPTWPNHLKIFALCGLETKKYRYYDNKMKWFNFDSLKQDICCLPERSIVLFHEVAQNPTGVDPSKEQWDQLSEVVKHRNHYTIFDMAYQGFASGDPVSDTYSLQKFLKDGNSFCLAQSFAKNMGLYGERIGALHFVTENSEEKAKMLSQLKMIIRACYSNPPLHGARIVAEILGNPELKKQWIEDVKGMSNRIKNIRKKLVETLKKAGSKHDWSHMEKQIGMFSYTGLTAPQAEQMVKKHHIYMMPSGRISIAGVNEHNVEYIANAMHDVTK